MLGLTFKYNFRSKRGLGAVSGKSMLWLSGLVFCLAGLDAGALTLESCHVEKIREQVLCGTLSVAENPALPQGKQISLNIVLLPGYSGGYRIGKSGSKKNPPLLILAGGPGQAATGQAGLIDHIFAGIRQTRDIVLIDQRGTGQSNPLKCTNLDLDGLGLALDPANEDLAAQAKACLALLQHADLAHYSTNQAIDDFEAVRQALGYQQFYLYGGSYGTRAGLVYLRRYPDSIAGAVLDSVAPTQVPIGLFGKSTERAFDLLISDCDEDLACHTAYPDLKGQLLKLLAALAITPGESVEHDTHQVSHPVSGQPAALLFERHKLLNTLRNALYSTSARKLLPLIITQASQGNYQPFLGLYATLVEGNDNAMYMGLTLTILCSEDWPRVTAQMIRTDDSNAVVGDLTSRLWSRMCSVWPTFPVAASFSQPVRSEVPVLLLSGRLDPVTPPAWGEMAAQTLSRSRHLVAVNGSHTVATHTCAAKLIAEFLNHGDLAALDDACLSKKQHQAFMLNSGSTSLGILK